MTQQQKPLLKGIVEAVAVAGNQTKLAETLGVKQQSVSMWMRRGWAPLKRALEIEMVTGVNRTRLINPRIADLVDLPGSGE